MRALQLRLPADAAWASDITENGTTLSLALHFGSDCLFFISLFQAKEQGEAELLMLCALCSGDCVD